MIVPLLAEMDERQKILDNVVIIGASTADMIDRLCCDPAASLRIRESSDRGGAATSSQYLTPQVPIHLGIRRFGGINEARVAGAVRRTVDALYA